MSPLKIVWLCRHDTLRGGPLIHKVIKAIMPSRVHGYLKYLLQYREAEKRAAAIAQKNKHKIESLMQGSQPIKLEMGAGCIRGIPGWTYVDANGQCDLTLDLGQSLPFGDNTVDCIYSSHLLEHFGYSDLLRFLSECLRILKPDGKFSAAVPDASIFLRAYHDPEAFNPDIYCRYGPAYRHNSKIDYVNYIAYMDGHHKYMFDEDSLLEVLINAGFRNVKSRRYDAVLDMESRDFQSIYAEAEK